jgi:hypothetical protein
MQIIDESKFGLVAGAGAREVIISTVLTYLGERALTITENQLAQVVDYLFNTQTPATNQNIEQVCTQYNIVPVAADNDG